MKTKYQVAILGCGAIFNRHITAIMSNANDFSLCGVFDIDSLIANECAQKFGVKSYLSLDELYADNNVNCVIILTPSHLHYQQTMQALSYGKHVIIEKPATFLSEEIKNIEMLANSKNIDVFCILQVRLNKTVQLMKKVLEDGVLGDIRGASLLQRWQRPASYFSGWRGRYDTSGGILREFAIHYLDVFQYLLGMPSVKHAQFYKVKFKDTDVSDTIYAMCDYKSFGANIEITVAAEPHNLECSLSIIGSNGYVKLSGKSLDVISDIKFLDEKSLDRFNELQNTVYSQQIMNQVNIGVCPHHPELYRLIVDEPSLFSIRQTYNVISLIENIYKLES